MKRTIIFWDFSNFFITLKGLAKRSVRFDFVKFILGIWEIGYIPSNELLFLSIAMKE